MPKELLNSITIINSDQNKEITPHMHFSLTIIRKSLTSGKEESRCSGSRQFPHFEDYQKIKEEFGIKACLAMDRHKKQKGILIQLNEEQFNFIYSCEKKHEMNLNPQTREIFAAGEAIPELLALVEIVVQSSTLYDEPCTVDFNYL